MLAREPTYTDQHKHIIRIRGSEHKIKLNNNC